MPYECNENPGTPIYTGDSPYIDYFVDTDSQYCVTYHYYVTAIASGSADSSVSNRVYYGTDTNPFKGIVEDGGAQKNLDVQNPAVYQLFQNSPNPFNPSTIINYTLAKNSHVNLRVYDVLGREAAVLVDEYQEAGERTVSFDGAVLPSGVYLYRLQAGTFVDMKKMVLIR